MNSALRLSLLILPLALTGSCASVCTTGACRTQAALSFAADHRFVASQIEGDGFAHDVFVRPAQTAQTLWIFIEGDGIPWSDDGFAIADDPTAPSPLALHLAVQTPGAVAYLGRPCYLTVTRDPRCTPAVWTVDRYSSAVVNSMNAAANKLADQQRSSRIVLVGHSGGGTIAALMASSLPRTVAVVTIAANLDTDEWNHRHGYWPLYGSRNPANEPPLPASMTQLHLVGDRDKNVTFEMNARYFARVPADSIRHYTSFDHTHEWVWEWPHVRRRLTDTFDSSSR